MTALRILSTTQAKKMDQLATMPWLKFDFTSYEQSEFRAANGPIARLAFVELTMRSIRTGFKLPKNDAALATWAGITKAQWAKVKDVVIDQFQDKGDHYFCAGIAELYGEYIESADKPQEAKGKNPKKPANPDISNKRRAAANARWGSENANDDAQSMQNQNLHDAKQMQNANLHDAKQMQNANLHTRDMQNADLHDANAMQKHANEGDIGGDLDQDLDLENNKHTQSACEDFTPDLDCLNDKLKMAGAQPVTQEQLSQTLVTFVPHYETHHLTDNQRMAKLVQWIKGDQAKAARPAKSKAKAEQPVYGNVNEAWGNPPPQDLDTGFVMPEELKAKIANLRSVKSS